jgi:hypothetical protein
LEPLWQGRDYDIITILTLALERGYLPLSTLINPDDSKDDVRWQGEWTWEKACTTVAKQEKQANWAHDGRMIAEAANVNIYLRSLIGVGQDPTNFIIVR